MNAPSPADDVLRGPKYAMGTWLFGPLPTLGLWELGTRSGWDVYDAMPMLSAFGYVHLLFVPVAVMVLSHRPVRCCAEGWLLAAYLLSVLAVVAVFMTGVGAPRPLGEAVGYTMCGTAALMPVVFLVRLLVPRRLRPV